MRWSPHCAAMWRAASTWPRPARGSIATARMSLPPSAPRRRGGSFLAQFQDVLVILLLVATAISAALWAYERDAALPYEAHRDLRRRAAQRDDGLRPGIARRSCGRRASRDVGRRCHGDPRAASDEASRQRRSCLGDIILIEEGDTIPADARRDRVGRPADGRSRADRREPAGHEGHRRRSPKRCRSAIGTTWSSAARPRPTDTARPSSPRPACAPRWGASPDCSKATPDETTPLQRELDRTGKMLGARRRRDRRRHDRHDHPRRRRARRRGALRCAHPRRGAGRRGGARRTSGGRHRGALDRRAAHGAAQRHRPAPRRGRDARLGQRHRLGQDRHADEERDDGARRRHRERARHVRRLGLRASRARFSATAAAPSTARCGSSSSARSPSPIAPTTPPLQERDGRWTVQGDPTEGALLVAARKAGLSSEALDERLPRVGEVPFSSERKLMSTVHRDAEQQDRGIVFTKGAPDVLLARCTRELVGEERRPLTPARRAEILADQRGARGPGAAHARRRRPVADERARSRSTPRILTNGSNTIWSSLGLIGIIDPPRPEAKEAVARARRAGIRPLMITGDHPRTACGHRAGARHHARMAACITGAELEKLTPEALARTRRGGVGLRARESRTQAAHRRRAAAHRRRRGHDGRRRERRAGAEDGRHRHRHGHHRHRRLEGSGRHGAGRRQLRLDRRGGRGRPRDLRQHPQVPALPPVVEHRRSVDDVLRRAAGRARSASTSAADAVVLPLLATQILWINLVTDGPPALALGVDPADDGLMDQPPRPVGERVITRAHVARHRASSASIMAAGTLFVLDASLARRLHRAARATCATRRRWRSRR